MVVLAGQSHESAPAYAVDQVAWAVRRTAAGTDLPDCPAWMGTLTR